ncbi:MAG: putative phosphohistidine phosphatase [Rickettsiales bacterium]|nr:putative phosphohistidine phosphatase [Rickettsiales bacterium]
MKRLYIMRHAKAVKDHPNGDHDRTLHSIGRTAALNVGRHMQTYKMLPKALYASSATRTQETAKIVASALNEKITIQESRKLYLASAGELLHFVNTLDDTIDSAMIVAHNPGVHQLGMLIAGSGNSKAFETLQQGMLTGTLLVFDVPVDHWERVVPASAILQAVIAPKELE